MSITSEILYTPEGGTVSLTSAEVPGTGYFVGGLTNPLVHDRMRDGHVEITRFVETVQRERLAPYLGWWTDGETGLLWVDGSDWFADREDAVAAGNERGEIAIYDVANQAEIRLV